jgi:hypothetical protein
MSDQAVYSVRILLLVICVITCGCVGVATELPAGAPPTGVLAVAPGAEKVTVTTNASVVASCVAVGNVSTLSPSGTQELKNLAVGLHADVVLLTAVGGVATKTTTEQSAEGVAYRCNSSAPP